MKIISFVNYKGGVSKTTTAFNIVGLMAMKKKKVLVVDCDAQGNMTFAFGIDKFSKEFVGLEQIFDKKTVDPLDIVREKPIEEMPTVDIIPCNIDLDASEMVLVNKTRREFILKKYIEKHADFFNKYDYVVMDTSPRFSIVNINVFSASDEIILVCNIDSNAYLGCVSVMETWGDITEDLEIANNIKGLIISKYDKRVKLSSELVDLIHDNEELNKIAFKTYIPENIKIRETVAAGLPLPYYDSKSVALLSFINLYKEMVKRGVL